MAEFEDDLRWRLTYNPSSNKSKNFNEYYNTLLFYVSWDVSFFPSEWPFYKVYVFILLKTSSTKIMTK